MPSLHPMSRYVPCRVPLKWRFRNASSPPWDLYSWGLGPGFLYALSIPQDCEREIGRTAAGLPTLRGVRLFLRFVTPLPPPLPPPLPAPFPPLLRRWIRLMLRRGGGAACRAAAPVRAGCSQAGCSASTEATVQSTSGYGILVTIGCAVPMESAHRRRPRWRRARRDGGCRNSCMPCAIAGECWRACLMRGRA